MKVSKRQFSELCASPVHSLTTGMSSLSTSSAPHTPRTPTNDALLFMRPSSGSARPKKTARRSVTFSEPLACVSIISIVSLCEEEVDTELDTELDEEIEVRQDEPRREDEEDEDALDRLVVRRFLSEKPSFSPFAREEESAFNARIYAKPKDFPVFPRIAPVVAQSESSHGEGEGEEGNDGDDEREETEEPPDREVCLVSRALNFDY